mgnify:CR=1 FL=1
MVNWNAVLAEALAASARDQAQLERRIAELRARLRDDTMWTRGGTR